MNWEGLWESDYQLGSEATTMGNWVWFFRSSPTTCPVHPGDTGETVEIKSHNFCNCWTEQSYRQQKAPGVKANCWWQQTHNTRNTIYLMVICQQHMPRSKWFHCNPGDSSVFVFFGVQENGNKTVFSRICLPRIGDKDRTLQTSMPVPWWMGTIWHNYVHGSGHKVHVGWRANSEVFWTILKSKHNLATSTLPSISR